MKVCLLGVCSLRHNPFNWLPSYYKKTFICLCAAQEIFFKESVKFQENLTLQNTKPPDNETSRPTSNASNF